MKKRHRKAIQSQANYLVKIYSYAKGCKKTVTMPGGRPHTYSRTERKKIRSINGPLYMDGNVLKNYIQGLSETKKAKLMRRLYKDLCNIQYDMRMCPDNRYHPLCGAYYNEKKLAFDIIRSI